MSNPRKNHCKVPDCPAMTQCDRVLTLARRFCGVCQAELYDPPDRRGPITRLAARIQDLEDQGHEFEILHDRKSTRVYRLVEEVDRGGGDPATTPLAAGAAASVSLFEVGVPEVPHWRYDGEAA